MSDMNLSRTFGLSDLSMTDFDGLIKLIYEGIDEPAPWTRLLNALLPLLSANYVSLMLRLPTHGLSWRVVFAGVAMPEIATTYETTFYAIDPFVNLPPDRMIMVDELIDESMWLKSPIYQEFLKPLNVRYYMGADLDVSGETICSFRVSRPASAVPFTEKERAICTLILPHLKLAVRMHSLKDVLDTERKVYAGTLERLAVGTVLLDKKGRVLSTNQAAAQILSERNGISLVQGKLYASTNNEKQELNRLIEQAISANAAMAPSVVAGMSITRSGGHSSLGILVRSAPAVEWLESANRPAAVLILRDSENKVQGSIDLIRRLYGLTPAEAALTLNLLEGMTIDEAASDLSISRNTARCQLRAIFAKTGVTRQTELISTLLTGIVPLE